MTLLLLIVGLVLWLVTGGTVETVGEVLTFVGGALLALQLAFFTLFAAIAVRTGRSYHQRFF